MVLRLLFVLTIVCLSVFPSKSATAQCVPRSFAANWLQQQERLGGHTIERHVNKTDQELVTRLLNDRRINASSSYTNINIATNQIQAALTDNARPLNQWARTARSGQKRSVDYRANTTVGRIAQRPAGLANIIDSTKLRAVLRADGKGGCILLTSYPVL